MTEAFICDGIRTAIGRYGEGLAAVRADDLGAIVLRELMRRNSDLDPSAIEEVYYGCANQAGEDNRNVARMSLLLAGLPVSVPGVTVNRLCASGLEAVGAAARAIRCGEAGLVIAGGVESMTRAPFVMAKPATPFARDLALQDTTMGWRFVNPVLDAMHGTETMPRTAENIAQEVGITREDQDNFALRSQQRAEMAQERGFFAGEIVPCEIPGRKGGETTLFAKDEHPRPGSSLAGLARLKPLFDPGGTITAGNASGINDGAAALIIADEAAAKRNGLTPRARILGMASAGVEPGRMGIGPLPAVGKLLSRLDLSIGDFDAIELNEAFASQSLAVLRGLGLPDDAAQVNPNGGAIALGHPLGMSGARLVLTLLRQLEQNEGRLGLATLCVGVGMGLALAIERV
ncbi:3-oxoadipyl-CoA thiolase [Altererythrobacter atlanticus]|uniref:3-oxoadipyl-CoA thiolase n=1 Tax=Croceibacterium atlanticum TaxID=1267766 RepID=A0A0F7KUK1_9SPHN|nr:3-oxoadipyl-CoA thiolase [Croceibacterium atlanticum]AKH42917.1 Beta-ketoadipyl-CoA thiolase [Croceibacterium atlanticum]MBB5731697.1 3-oxoadipyl-CoA thiolase [Croceibacterium atlanticum]